MHNFSATSLIHPHLTELLQQDTVSVSKQLLGWELRYHSPTGMVGGTICETEAYTDDDPASHTYGGTITRRNAPMFEAAGTIYIYLIYGMYHCLNIVTESPGVGAATLIRGVIPTIGRPIIQANRPNVRQSNNPLNGPGKLMLGLGIPPSLNNASLLTPNCPITLHPPKKRPAFSEHPRIGISKGTDRLWRFMLA